MPLLNRLIYKSTKKMSDKNYIKTILHNFTRHETSEETRQKFRQWITDPKDRKAKDEALGNLWDETQAPYSFADEKGWQRLSAEIAAGQRRSRMRMWRRAVLGAVAVLVAGLFISQYLLLSNRIERAARDRTPCYVTSQESKGVFTLPDGTSVWLNGNSRLTLSEQFDGTQRRVKLEGEGFFDVSRNPERPFIVEIGRRQIEVLGTAFDVKSYAHLDYQEVVLVRGSIDIHSEGGRTVRLKPNDRYVARTQGAEESVMEVDASDYSHWMDRLLIFDNKPLGNILVSLERWYNMEFDVARNVNLSAHLSFNVKYESVDEILRAVSLIIPIRYNIDYVNNRVHISAKQTN